MTAAPLSVAMRGLVEWQGDSWSWIQTALWLMPCVVLMWRFLLFMDKLRGILDSGALLCRCFLRMARCVGRMVVTLAALASTPTDSDSEDEWEMEDVNEDLSDDAIPSGVAAQEGVEPVERSRHDNGIAIGLRAGKVAEKVADFNLVIAHGCPRCGRHDMVSRRGTNGTCHCLRCERCNRTLVSVPKATFASSAPSSSDCNASCGQSSCGQSSSDRQSPG